MILRAYKGTSPRIGERVFVAENAVLIGDVELGDDSSIWYGTVLRADVFPIRIGARTNIQDQCSLHVTNGKWPIVIEEEVTLGHGVIAHGCTIRKGCLIGMGAIILDGADIGSETIVAAGTLVPEGMHIPQRSLVLGTPGRIKRSLTDDDLPYLHKFHRNYLGYKDEYLAEERKRSHESQ